MEIKLETKIKILSSSDSIYEAFVEPENLKNFWFTYSSQRWESGKTISLGYCGYNMKPFDIKIVACMPNESIVFVWGNERRVSIKIIPVGKEFCIVEVCEDGFVENSELRDLLIDSKGGWVFMLACLKAYLECGVNTLNLGMFIE